MDHRTKAGIKATATTGIGAGLLLVPGVNVFIFLAVMLPLSVLDAAGIPALGDHVHGFFVPSAIGWSLVALVVWLLSFVVFLKLARKDAGRHPPTTTPGH